jgi:hypothetical protein
MARKAFVVTDAMCERVRSLASVSARQDNIAKIIGCNATTLRAYFSDELEHGMVEANAEIAGHLFASATAGNVVAQIFWLKTRARWREREAPEETTQRSDAEATTEVVVILPDHERDPQHANLLS